MSEERAAVSAAQTRVVDVLPHLRTAKFDRALTYAVPEGLTLAIGDVVRAPLGSREVYGYVVSEPRVIETVTKPRTVSGSDASSTNATMHLSPGASATGREHDTPRKGGAFRALAGKVDAPRAFDADGLRLAEFIAERYCCSLGEALASIVFAGAIPRAVDRLVPIAERPNPARFASVPPRLITLIWEDLSTGFGLETLLRHPDARRAGDRRALLSAVTALVRAGVLRRERSFESPRMREARERVLELGEREVRGPRVRALVDLVGETGHLRRADALLAGFSAAVIARALREGALRESHELVATERRPVSGSGDAGLIATAEQAAAIDVLVKAADARTFAEFLLQGVTGSGKTFVYIAAIARVLEHGGRGIVLVPEIALTPQTARRFENAFGSRVAVLHSGLSERERYESWQAAARGEVDVVVGARSAVFAQLPNLRLIVIDEAHERTYKQDATPRYDTLAVARERMRMANGVLVLGSATPPLEAYAAALEGRIGHLRIAERATSLPLPAVEVVDMAREFERGNRRAFSTALVDGIASRLERGEKVVLFVNRRGSATFVLCRACGFVPTCARCSLAFVAHRSEGLLRCHLCDAQELLVAQCPTCSAEAFREFGIGTQRVAELAEKLFPNARVVRMDSDTTTRVGDHARLLDAFRDEADILVGTQMVAKGLDFPTVTLVGVVAADIGLHVADFRAAERTFDLITQVAGRSGRARLGEAIVQTYAPDNVAIAHAAHHDFDGFAKQELVQRRELGYPPYGELIYFGVLGRRRADVEEAADRYATALRTVPEADILGPAPYAIARANNEWRYRIAAKAQDSTRLRAFIRERLQPQARADQKTRLLVNVDP